ncbi:MAG: ABC-F family ATP-binding cassette domain-containing protein [Eggerthellales bacterium]|nr:ABC-F family ATP-binding cassette domain-containing protein [Eggerthellales bacterium]
MAFLLGCEKICVDYPTKQVFQDLSLGVDEGARIGIVGRNGDGKSTLLKVLTGAVEPDEGRVYRTRGVTVGLLGQTDDLDPESTVERAVVGTMETYEWASSPKVRDIIAGLLSDVPWDARVGTLSGGQRRRVDLARLLVGDWDVLALDEPTNHLDIRAITWLAQHLKTRWRAGQGALLVVTHDRWFLDEVCLDMWEVLNKRVEPFEGGFSAYILQRVERDRLADLAEQKRQNQLRRELAWLSRGARARATKPKFHVATAQALIADVPPLRDTLELKRMAMARLGKQVIDVENATVSFDGKPPVLNDVTWLIGAGDRFGIVGENGAGKTTLLRLIKGELAPDKGRVKIGQTVRFAVLSQHLDNLTALGNDRVRQVISRYNARVMLDGKESTPAQLLERLGFSHADLNEPVCDLSGGQKRRLALMLILLDEPNVLILDEPGNDLDTDMLAVVEDMLDTWPGTLILVTHDRYLMERVTDNQYALINGTLRHLPGGVDEYLRLAAASGGVADARAVTNAAVATGATPAVAAPANDSAPKISGGQQREMRKQMASLERKTETLRGKISQAQERMSQADPSDYLALGAIQDEIATFQAQIDDMEMEWLELAEALGE